MTMSLFGFISTSPSKVVAERFSFDDEAKGKKAVLFEIHWTSCDHYYCMDMSAFTDEQEFLLNDGCSFIVKSVENQNSSEGKPIVKIILEGPKGNSDKITFDGDSTVKIKGGTTV